MIRIPSSISSWGAPGNDAANHSTLLPEETSRRATSKVNVSAPPARGLRGQRQLSIRILRRQVLLLLPKLLRWRSTPLVVADGVCNNPRLADDRRSQRCPKGRSRPTLG